VTYNPRWPDLFAMEVNELVASLPLGIALRYEHFGSTAVPGLAAKPIVDMLIEVCSLEGVKQRVVPLLESRGYDYFWRDDVSPPYPWFIKRDANGQRTHHLHMVEANSTMWQRLLFRDYLMKHADEAERYAELKRELAARYPNDRIAYTSGKSDYIASVMEKAKSEPPAVAGG